ncbi:MAG: 3-oxoacyl-ACP synthase [Brumimicrobium sp.]
MKNKITHYCNIKNGKISLNGKLVFENQDEPTFLKFIKSAYKTLKIDYPKFYKMDPLCKLSLVASTILLDSMESIDSEMALLLCNRSSCIDIDKEHQSSISYENGGYASPATFVYTLPNIALGEISIKYKLKSENSFFIFENFNPKFMIDYSESLINLGKSKSVLCGWLEVNQDEYNAFVFIVEPKEGEELSVEKLNKLL